MPMRQLLFRIASVGHLSPGRKWDILSPGQNVAWGESGTFCRLGQFVARKMPVGHFVAGTKCLLTDICLSRLSCLYRLSRLSCLSLLSCLFLLSCLSLCLSVMAGSQKNPSFKDYMTLLLRHWYAKSILTEIS